MLWEPNPAALSVPLPLVGSEKPKVCNFRGRRASETNSISETRPHERCDRAHDYPIW